MVIRTIPADEPTRDEIMAAAEAVIEAHEIDSPHVKRSERLPDGSLDYSQVWRIDAVITLAYMIRNRTPAFMALVAPLFGDGGNVDLSDEVAQIRAAVDAIERKSGGPKPA